MSSSKKKSTESEARSSSKPRDPHYKVNILNNQLLVKESLGANQSNHINSIAKDRWKILKKVGFKQKFKLYYILVLLTRVDEITSSSIEYNLNKTILEMHFILIISSR